MLSIDIFSTQFDRLRLRWNINLDLANEYYKHLRDIPDDRFEQVCDRVFFHCDFLPPPAKFLEFSLEIAKRQALNAPQLKGEEDNMTLEQIEANRKRLSAMVAKLAKSMEAPDYADF